MEICVIHKMGAKTEQATHVQMLWVASCTGETICSFGAYGYLLYMISHWEKIPSKVKYLLTYDMMERNPEKKPDELEVIKKAYDIIKIGKTLRNKSKEMIVSVKKAESILNEIYKETKEIFIHTTIANKTFELINLIEPDTKNRRKPMVALTFDEDIMSENPDEIIMVVTRLLISTSALPLVCPAINTILNGAEMNNLGMMILTPTFIYDSLFEIPLPETLNSSQLAIVRNELSIEFWNYFNKIETLQSEINEILFTKDNFKKIIELFNTKTKELKPLLQKSIDTNEILNELKNNDGKNKISKISIGITSFQHLLNYYNKVEVVNNDMMPYINEEIEKTLNPGNCCLFLFLDK